MFPQILTYVRPCYTEKSKQNMRSLKMDFVNYFLLLIGKFDTQRNVKGYEECSLHIT